MAQAASQKFVPIKDIRDGIVTLENGGMRAVLLTSSINFSLKSADERQATLAQFQNFLNTLDFAVQIVIQSRELDITPYIHLLESQLQNELNELMKIQTEQYIEFIKEFTEETNIMTKSFFVVVPYTPAVLRGSGKTGWLGSLFGSSDNNKKKQQQAERQFEENRTQLDQRVSVVQQGLSSAGVRAVKLGDEEVTELFYHIFNPGEGEKPAS